MKFRTSVATAVAATAAVLAVGAVPANAATAAAKPTALTIKASTTHAQYGQWVELSAHLGRTASNRTVEIDNGRSVVKKGHVDAHGNLTAWVKAAHNATFVAKFAGDSRDKSASAHVRVNTAVVIAQDIYQGSRHADGWWYIAGNNGVWAEAIVSPNKVGEPVYFHVQQELNGRWYDVKLNYPSGKLDSRSYAAHGYRQLPAGLVLRMATTFNGDASNTGSGLSWLYVKTI
jgi:hypothetical protein